MRAQKMRSYLSDNGLWRIDKRFGKNLLVIELQNNETGLSYVPSHDEFCQALEKMLEAELKNDLFVFENGVYGENSQRPPQIHKKLNQIRNTLNKVATEAIRKGIKLTITDYEVF